MLSEDIIELSNSEWNFPLILVPKEGTMRPVIENKLFNAIYIKSAFWQTELHGDPKDVTAFPTPTGYYRFKRMPFGLANSPLTYMSLMNTVLHDLLGNTASVFLDDIPVVLATEEHFRKLHLIFSRLASAGLKVKLEKCQFLQDKVIYLEHQIDSNGLRTVKSKGDAVKNFPVTRTMNKAMSFFGLTGYYRQFIREYAHITNLLSSLLRKLPHSSGDQNSNKSLTH